MKSTRLSCASFCKRTYTMFEKKYNNCSIVGAEAAGVVYRRAVRTNGFGQCALTFRRFLKEYQAAYRLGQALPTPPEQLTVYLKSLRAKFRLETDNIENMVKAAYRIRLPQLKKHETNNPKSHKRNTVRRNRRK